MDEKTIRTLVTNVLWNERMKMYKGRKPTKTEREKFRAAVMVTPSEYLKEFEAEAKKLVVCIEKDVVRDIVMRRLTA